MIKSKIDINLDEKSYQICIGENILYDIGKQLVNIAIGKKCAIITNPVINHLFGSKIISNLENEGFKVIVLEVPDGEKYKSLTSAKMLYDKLLSNGIDRKSCLIALGGGVIGDLTGFVAATYMRGISFIQVPTTLLSQIDSSVGGKTAINLPRGKNLIGVFHQPKLVWIDVETLKTLPERELLSGFAEAIKYAMISDKKLFYYLKNNSSKIKNHNTTFLLNVISKCCKIKASIVEKDEKEQGLRMILNYGHTFGHALENLSNYNLRHGEAVAIGMICAADASEQLSKVARETVFEQENLIRSVNLPTTIDKNISSNDVIKTIQLDKKNCNGCINLVVPRSIGNVSIEKNVSKSLIKNVIEKRVMRS